MKNIIEVDLENHDIYQHKVWGDTDMISTVVNRDRSKFGDEVIGEVFLASTHRDGISVFKDGRDFDSVIATDPHVFGAAITPKKAFPLLLKILSANQELSIQTHYKNKIEAWITLSEGEIFYGLTPLGEEAVSTKQKREEFHALLKVTKDKEELAQYFNHIHFQPGQAFIVHAGMLHALLRGTVFEPQKNCNLTLRGGDWGRNLPNRPLDKEDFFQSLHPFATSGHSIEKLYKMKSEQAHHACIFATQDFALDEIVLREGSRTIETFEDRFFIAMVMDGEVTLSDAHEEEVFSKGQVFVMCATPNQWTFSGTGRILLTYVPNLVNGIITPLYDNGYSYEEIVSIGGPLIKENDIYIEMKEKGLL